MLRCLTALPLIICAGLGQAASVDVEQILTIYNAVSSGDFNSQQEVEGRLYVGGDLTGSQIQTGFVADLPNGPNQNVVVLGNATIGKISGRGEIVIGGDANTQIEQSGGNLETFVGGSYSGLNNFNTVTSGQSGDLAFEAKFPQIDFAGIVSYSAYLSGLTGEDLVFADPNQKRFDALNNAIQSEGDNWDASRVTILNVSLDQLSSGTFLADVDQDETVIVNVSGTAGTYGMNASGGKSAATQILWNFYEAETLQVNSAIIGSVLAPNAFISGFGGSTEGSVLAREISLTNGELHLQPFRGDLPDQPGQVTAVPLPASLPLLLAAFGGLAVLRRRYS
ncbi:choice-of-anchor A family protein [Actibacterium sp. 188UL27-1]|uniref:choice-of-anchor A family protein n=1 Tax=Actibacterium sp. 188UL27-1 TaxID=2786961 RepID=UPI0019598FDB|nr:choice-of-anchor A family protein [Actibacterium sp. 188UL27-1]MBM7067583.1 choice-of-anchor A family protein [Actibacterium sp. 188UL27-1]